MPRARRGLWRRERAGIDASSMTVRPACDGKSRRKSSGACSWSGLLRFTTRRHLLQFWTPVPFVLGRFKRFASGFDGVMATTCVHDPIQSARACAAGGSCGRYRRVDLDGRLGHRERPKKFLPDPLTLSLSGVWRPMAMRAPML